MIKLLASILLITATAASANEDFIPGDPLSPSAKEFRHVVIMDESANPFSELSIAPESSAYETYLKTQEVLKDFDISPEAAADFSSYLQTQSFKTYLSLLPWMDHFEQMPRFTETNSNQIELFSDRDSKKISEGSIAFGSGEALQSVRGLNEKLRTIALQKSDTLPLKGLRVALDPGHMGTDLWDERTGKFALDKPTNRKISEGVINLQTCLLLEKRLKDLGAEVMITHRTLAPVTPVPYASLNIAAFAKEELRASSTDDWFQTLLAQHASGSDLAEAFRNSSDVKAMYSEDSRSHYFILEEDLDARSKAIEAFQPDITLIIHYDVRVSDTSPHGLDPAGFDATKAYVVGGFMSNEFATLGQRADFARHALDAEAWNASLNLAREAAHQISTQLHVPLETPSGDNQVLIEPGVIARNLAVSRKVNGHAVAYIESLYYNAPAEFNAIYAGTHPLLIGGVNTPYSDRVASVAKALGDAILNFLKSYE